MKWKVAFLVVMLTNLAISQDLKINELMYAPSGGEPEWIELYNASSDSLNLKNWKIANHNGKLYTLSTSDFYVLSNSYIVITKSETIFAFHPTISSRVLVCSGLPAAFLVNGGDTISVRDSAGALVDSMFYQPSWGGSGGKSIERISVDASSCISTNWGTSQDTSGSSPGRRNSIAARQNDLMISSFTANLLLSKSLCEFNLTIKNSGVQTVHDYVIMVFLDYNSDHAPQSDELVASVNNTPILGAGDSAQFTFEVALAGSRRLSALAQVAFDNDEDTTDNIKWTRLNISHPARSVVVNEIMYAPANSEPEWVELFNTTEDSIDLKGFTLADNSNTEAQLSPMEYFLPPSDYVVVAHDSSFLDIHPSVANRVLVGKIPSLNNTGDAVVIRDASGSMMDSVSYSPSWGGNAGGKSLERILPLGDSNDPRNYETCTDTAKSTPGRINSVTPRNHDLAVGNITSWPVQLQSGASAAVTANIINAGLQQSESSTAILFRDADHDSLFSQGELVDSAAVASLLPGDSLAVSLHTGKLSHGTYNFGIFIDFHDDEQKPNNTKTVLINVGLSPAALIVNEVMYAPKQPEQEWLEFQNTGDEIIDMSDFRIVTHGSSVKIKAGLLLAPHAFAVLCKDSSVSQLHYQANNLILQSCPSLNNGGDGVGLYDNLGNLLDTMSYKTSYGGSTGRSIERVDYLAGNDSTNWQESVDSTGATPGIENSIAMLPFDAAIKRIDLSAAAVTPGESAIISVILSNVGRNPLSDVTLHVLVTRVPDSRPAFSQTQALSRVLAPKDSEAVEFQCSFSNSGLYAVAARATASNDPRLWNDTLTAWMKVKYEPQAIVVNEIMFTEGAGGEYFEIFNASQDSVNLTGWSFHTASSEPKPIDSSPVSCALTPGGYFVVAADSSILSLVRDTNSVQVSKSLTLRDGGDCVTIADPAGAVVDSVCYLPSWHNGDIARTSGRSLEKINPCLPSNERTSWSTSVSQSGGTPATRNSLYVNSGQITSAISVAPNPFSPDADGHDDFTFINYSFPVTSVKIRIRIFDSVGRLIATPTDNAVLPSTGRLVWDGRDGSGKIVRFGLYILFLEVTGPDGKSLSTYKTPLVVAKKMR